MLPIVDYGGIALVVPMITAVGSIFDNDGKASFEVYLTGMNEPFVIGFGQMEEAEESRDELVAIIAQYHYVKELGPEFDIEDLLSPEDNDNSDKH